MNEAEQAKARIGDPVDMRTVWQEYVTSEGTDGPVIVAFNDDSVLLCTPRGERREDEIHQEVFDSFDAFEVAFPDWKLRFKVWADEYLPPRKKV